MNNKKKLKSLLFAVIILISAIFAVPCGETCSAQGQTLAKLNPGWGFKHGGIRVGKAALEVDIADTMETRERGLSGRQKLGNLEGMLFIHDHPGRPVYWMVDMNFPLDFIWIRNNRVVDISENVPPPSNKFEEPARINSRKMIDSAIEVNAGFIKRYGIRIGDTVRIGNPNYITKSY